MNIENAINSLTTGGKQTQGSRVESDSQVFLHLDVILQDGSVAESSRTSGTPTIIQLGDQSISHAMELKLMGLQVGEKKTFSLDAVDAFGETSPDLIHYMDLHQFPDDIELQPGLVVAFEQPSGGTLPGIIQQIQGHSVKVDFNHPLAGQTVTFQVEILSIDREPQSTGSSAN